MPLSINYQMFIKYIQAAVDIFVVWWLLMMVIKGVKKSQRTVQLFQGVIFIILIQVLSEVLGLRTVYWLASNLVSWGLVAVIIIFQPEIRAFLESLGKNNAFARITTLSASEKEKLIDEIIEATASLSASKTGALICLEQSNSLSEFIKTGIAMNSNVSAELLCSIFMTTTPLHDGAVIIQGDRLACASAYFPPTSQDLPSKYGARHRAAIGISEITDAFTIVVSEESGRVSVTMEGRIIKVNENRLRELLNQKILNKESKPHENIAIFNNSNDSSTVDSFVSTDTKKASDSRKDNTRREMKSFLTQNFKEEEKPKTMVEKVVASTINENNLDSTVEINTVASGKTGVINIIKTTNVTTGTDTLPSQKLSNNGEIEQEGNENG